jgi:hypothetical protein
VGSNPASNLKLFMLVLTLSLPHLQLYLLSVEIPQDMTIINDENHLRSSLPSLQTSLYSLPLWVRQSGQLQSLLISVYRSSIAGAQFSDLSLQITAYEEEDRKKIFKIFFLDAR